MAIIQRRGDIIPGIDCRTGQSIGHIRAEWQYLIKDLKVEHSLEHDTTKVYDSNGQLVYEIYSVQFD